MINKYHKKKKKSKNKEVYIFLNFKITFYIRQIHILNKTYLLRVYGTSTQE